LESPSPVQLSWHNWKFHNNFPIGCAIHFPDTATGAGPAALPVSAKPRNISKMPITGLEQSREQVVGKGWVVMHGRTGQ